GSLGAGCAAEARGGGARGGGGPGGPGGAGPADRLVDDEPVAGHRPWRGVVRGNSVRGGTPGGRQRGIRAAMEPDRGQVRDGPGPAGARGGGGGVLQRDGRDD